jgi:Diacylglycerol acyltransferase
MSKFVYGTVNCWFQVPFNSMLCCASIFGVAMYHGNMVVRTSLAAYFMYGILDPSPITGHVFWSYDTINGVFRHFWGFRHVTKFFPVTLQKTQDLDPNNNRAYVFLYHPHGVISMGCSCALTTNGCNFDDVFPGIKRWGTTLNASFWCPFFREWLLCNGFLCANKSTLVSKLLHSKESVVLIPGGAVEALHAHPGVFRLYLKNRKGFIKLALETGAALVPCIGFGENGVFSTYYAEDSSSTLSPSCPSSNNNHTGISLHSPSWLLQLQHAVYKTLTFSTPILKHPFPLQRKIQVIVGAPVQFEDYSQCQEKITSDLVDKCHAQYLKALQTLYNKHKEECGYKDIPIEFL